MITILKKPEKKKVKLFKCQCGCEFTAEVEDYKIWYSATEDHEYYDIKCPFCKENKLFDIDFVEEIEVNVIN